MDRFNMMGYPQWWAFDLGPVPAPEEVLKHRVGPAGGGYVGTGTARYCPRCTEAADSRTEPRVPR